MHNLYDPDEWEMVAEFDGRLGTMTQRRRHPDDIKRIKARRKLEHQAAVLLEAAGIVREEMPLLADALLARSWELLSHG